MDITTLQKARIQAVLDRAEQYSKKAEDMASLAGFYAVCLDQIRKELQNTPNDLD